MGTAKRQFTDPVFALWESDPLKRISVEEIKPLLAAHFEKSYEKWWEVLGRASLDARWFQSRRKGLKAYAAYEADFRLRQQTKTSLTLSEFMAFHLADAVSGKDEAAIAEDFYKDFMDYMRRNPSADFYNLLANKLNQGGRTPNQFIKLYALLYDVNMIPLEFWTNTAAAHFMSCYFTRLNRSENFTGAQIKMWKRDQLKLKETKPFIVSEYKPVSGALRFNASSLKAARHHGLPLPDDVELAKIPIRSRATNR